MSDLSVLKSRVSRAKAHWDKTLEELHEVQGRVEHAQAAWQEAQDLLGHALQGEGRE